MEYRKRFADQMLAERLESAGAVLIEGVRGCGKSETAMRRARSAARFGESDGIREEDRFRVQMEIDPNLALQGATPRLIDEWQEHPKIWNHVRRAVDELQEKGLFILTASAKPDDSVARHSGAGRFSVFKMRPMSLFESGWSTGEASLSALLEGIAPHSKSVPFDLGEMAEKITLGGWPGMIGHGAREGLRHASEYVDRMAESDICRVSGKRRDPDKVIGLIRSLAHRVCTPATLTDLSKGTGGSGVRLDDETVASYLFALERMMAVENLQPYVTRIRSSDTLRKSPKRLFADPSLAVGALGLSVDGLLSDLNLFCLLFESLAIRDLRIYSDLSDCRLFHYRDSRGLEADAVVECADGTWGAFAIRLGIGAVDAAAKELVKFAGKIDTAKAKAPSSLTVITGNGFAHRRPDGVNVVPLPTLTA